MPSRQQGTWALGPTSVPQPFRSLRPASKQPPWSELSMVSRAPPGSQHYCSTPTASRASPGSRMGRCHSSDTFQTIARSPQGVSPNPNEPQDRAISTSASSPSTAAATAVANSEGGSGAAGRGGGSSSSTGNVYTSHSSNHSNRSSSTTKRNNNNNDNNNRTTQHQGHRGDSPPSSSGAGSPASGKSCGSQSQKVRPRQHSHSRSLKRTRSLETPLRRATGDKQVFVRGDEASPYGQWTGFGMFRPRPQSLIERARAEFVSMGGNVHHPLGPEEFAVHWMKEVRSQLRHSAHHHLLQQQQSQYPWEQRAALQDTSKILGASAKQAVALRVAQLVSAMDLTKTGKISMDEWVHYTVLANSRIPALRSTSQIDAPLVNALRRRSCALGELQDLFSAGDLFGTGLLDLECIAEMYSSGQWTFGPSAPGGGMIPYEDLQQRDPEELAREALQVMDLDGDGLVGYGEFMAYCAGRRKEQVSIHFYDLTEGLAQAMSPCLLGQDVEGVWHTAIVAYGKEYFYGGEIYYDKPAATTFGRPTKKLDLGPTLKRQSELHDFIVDELRSIFNREVYDVVYRNCNHFTDTLCLWLTGKRLPSEVIKQPEKLIHLPITQLMRPLLSQWLGNIQGSQGDGAGHIKNEGKGRPQRQHPAKVAKEAVQVAVWRAQDTDLLMSRAVADLCDRLVKAAAATKEADSSKPPNSNASPTGLPLNPWVSELSETIARSSSNASNSQPIGGSHSNTKDMFGSSLSLQGKRALPGCMVGILAAEGEAPGILGIVSGGANLGEGASEKTGHQCSFSSFSSSQDSDTWTEVIRNGEDGHCWVRYLDTSTNDWAVSSEGVLKTDLVPTSRLVLASEAVAELGRDLYLAALRAIMSMPDVDFLDSSERSDGGGLPYRSEGGASQGWRPRLAQAPPSAHQDDGAEVSFDGDESLEDVLNTLLDFDDPDIGRVCL